MYIFKFVYTYIFNFYISFENYIDIHFTEPQNSTSTFLAKVLTPDSIKTLKEQIYRPISKIKMERDILGSKRSHKRPSKKSKLSRKLEHLQFSKKKLSTKTQNSGHLLLTAPTDQLSPSLLKSTNSTPADTQIRLKVLSLQTRPKPTLESIKLRKKASKFRQPRVFIKTGFLSRNQKSKKRGYQTTSRVLTADSRNDVPQIRSLKDAGELTKWRPGPPNFSFEEAQGSFKGTPSMSSFKTEGSQVGTEFNIYCRRGGGHFGKGSESESQGEVIYRKSLASQRSDKKEDRVFSFTSLIGRKKKKLGGRRMVDLKKLLKKQKKGKHRVKTGYLSQNTPS